MKVRRINNAHLCLRNEILIKVQIWRPYFAPLFVIHRLFSPTKCPLHALIVTKSSPQIRTFIKISFLSDNRRLIVHRAWTIAQAMVDASANRSVQAKKSKVK